MAWDLNGGFEKEIGWRIEGMVGFEGYMCMVPIHVGRSKDENIGNHGYIGTSILRIYRRYILRIFWKKISVSLKLLKTHENVRKTS